MTPGAHGPATATPAGTPPAPPARRTVPVIVLRLAQRVPAPLRGPLVGPLALFAERIAKRVRRGAALPALAVALRSAAGPRSRAVALAAELASLDRRSAAGRAGMIETARAAGLPEALEAIVAARPSDRSPALETARADLAYRAGRFSEAVEHAGRAGAAGYAPASQVAALASGHLAVLRPGDAPPLGPSVRLPGAARPEARPGRVLHIVSSSLPFKGAGYNVRTAAVAACQRAVGLDPHVAVRTGYGSAVHRGGSARRMIEGTPVTWLEAPPGTGHPHDRLQAVSARSAAALAAELRPSVLHAASDYLQAQLALALREPVGVPVVYEARGFWEETWASGRPEGEAAAMTSERYLLSRAAETAAMLAADAVVTLSDVMREEIVARGCPADRVVVVPNAVDADRFPVARRDTALGASLGIGPDDPVVGYVSTLNGYEGIGYLLEAAALLRSRVPGLRVLVVGDGPDEPAIRATASRLGLDDGTLVMPGRVGHDVIPRYYSLIDVFVVPRTADRVARLVTPLKPYEAMALGKAVVVSDLPALREVVAPGETGLTFRAEDPADLAEVVGGLLDDPVLRRRLGEQARAWVLTERTWAANGRRYRDLYERLGVALA